MLLHQTRYWDREVWGGYFRLEVLEVPSEVCLLGRGLRNEECLPCAHLEEDCYRQREQHVQRPCGGSVPGMREQGGEEPQLRLDMAF